MMNHDDDLDRALFALPLAEPPAGLRASILRMTVYAPLPIMRTWETVGIGIALALLAWLVVSIATSGGPIVHLAGAGAQTIVGVLSDRESLMWLGMGGVAAMIIVLADVRPAMRRRS